MVVRSDLDRVVRVYVNKHVFVADWIIHSGLVPHRIDHEDVGGGLQSQQVVQQRMRERFAVVCSNELSVLCHQHNIESRRFKCFLSWCLVVVMQSISLLGHRYCKHKSIKSDCMSKLKLEEGLSRGVTILHHIEVVFDQRVVILEVVLLNGHTGHLVARVIVFQADVEKTVVFDRTAYCFAKPWCPVRVIVRPSALPLPVTPWIA